MSDPRTVVLIHGLWMTPLSWEHWIDRLSQRGHTAIAPAWPGMDRDVESLRRDTASFERVGVTEVADRYEAAIRELERPPIIIGHSFGGLVTQILLDRGLGAAGVALAPAPPKGVLFLPPSALRVASVALRNPANRRRAKMLTAQQFRYAFANTLTEEQANAAYDRYAVPGPGRPLFQAAAASFLPHAPTRIDFRNDRRAPLLLIGSDRDHTVPASVVRQNHRLYRHSAALAEYRDFPGRSHFTVGEPGWEAVADHAIEWAQAHAADVAVAR